MEPAPQRNNNNDNPRNDHNDNPASQGENNNDNPTPQGNNNNDNRAPHGNNNNYNPAPQGNNNNDNPAPPQGNNNNDNPAQAANRNPLQEIQNTPALRLRLHLWEKEDDLLRERIEQKENALSKTQNEIYQLFGLYFVFQGVILTALAQASAMKCRHWGIPFVLTTFAFVGIMFAVLYKLRACDRIEHERDIEKANSMAIKRTMQQFVGLGIDYDPNVLEHHPVVIGVATRSTQRWKIAITVSIIAFWLVIAVSCPLILCVQN